MYIYAHLSVIVMTFPGHYNIATFRVYKITTYT